LAREHWYFLFGMLAVLVPLALLYAVKKLQLLEPRPDQRIVYAAEGGPELELHLFRARGRDGPSPALLLFHGGRWLYGSPRDLYPHCRYFAARGYTCISAGYRLGTRSIPEVRGALADARAAYNHLVAHAADLGLDPARIAVGGSSSGGHLAAALAAGLPGAGATPAAAILYNPMLDLSPGKPDHHLVADYWREVSPLHNVQPGFSPTLVLSGDEDPEVPVATVEAFCAALERAGSVCEAEIYPGRSHGFFHYVGGRNPDFDSTGERAVTFLKTQLGG